MRAHYPDTKFFFILAVSFLMIVIAGPSFAQTSSYERKARISHLQSLIKTLQFDIQNAQEKELPAAEYDIEYKQKNFPNLVQGARDRLRQLQNRVVLKRQQLAQAESELRNLLALDRDAEQQDALRRQAESQRQAIVVQQNAERQRQISSDQARQAFTRGQEQQQQQRASTRAAIAQGAAGIIQSIFAETLRTEDDGDDTTSGPSPAEERLLAEEAALRRANAADAARDAAIARQIEAEHAAIEEQNQLRAARKEFAGYLGNSKGPETEIRGGDATRLSSFFGATAPSTPTIQNVSETLQFAQQVANGTVASLIDEWVAEAKSGDFKNEQGFFVSALSRPVLGLVDELEQSATSWMQQRVATKHDETLLAGRIVLGEMKAVILHETDAMEAVFDDVLSRISDFKDK